MRRKREITPEYIRGVLRLMPGGEERFGNVSEPVNGQLPEVKEKVPEILTPEEQLRGGCKTPLIIGDIHHAELILVGESQWDICAMLDRLGVHKGVPVAGIATRGASNARLAFKEDLTALAPQAKIIFVRQMDEAGLA